MKCDSLQEQIQSCAGRASSSRLLVWLALLPYLCMTQSHSTVIRNAAVICAGSMDDCAEPALCCTLHTRAHLESSG